MDKWEHVQKNDQTDEWTIKPAICHTKYEPRKRIFNLRKKRLKGTR